MCRCHGTPDCVAFGLTIGKMNLRLHASAGASLRETCAKHVLEHLEDMRGTGHLPQLAKQHRSELRRSMTAYLRRQLVAAKPDPFRGSHVASSACGDSPRSARSLASSRPGKPILVSRLYLATAGLNMGCGCMQKSPR